MTRRKYPQFFDQPSTLSDAIYEAEKKELAAKPKVRKVGKKKKKPFVDCQECELYSAKPDGKFGCTRTGQCIHLEEGLG